MDLAERVKARQGAFQRRQRRLERSKAHRDHVYAAHAAQMGRRRGGVLFPGFCHCDLCEFYERQEARRMR